ncbi:alpha/beta hydrolase [Ramlibacter henchirensis]|uniref:Alpha/beta hydrolase n=1 Tax=Ramlibacter henchirensis TaxID=204072 RepID=A0A4Z0BXC6_9BURK|nr:alpha/beta hydrolase [Ramlibacter henchirensis]TFZ02928.1 alpha/beta hydrolase [Ramlibacter henchirensis]
MSAGERLPGTPQPMHRWSGAGGVSIAGDAWGDPRDPLVILQHGGGQTRHAWKGTGRALGAAGYHAVAFDARGHGDSDWAEDGAYSQDVMVQDLRCVVHALGDRPCILVGASMGGGTSLVAAGEGAVDARALVLVDIAPRIEPEGVEHIHAFMFRNPDGFASLEEVADAIASYQPHRPRAANLLGLAKNVRRRENGRLYWHWDPRFLLGHRNLTRRQQRLEECARALTIPTMLVRGAQSDVLSDEGVEQFKALAPHSEFLSISSAGHMVAGDRNDVFGDAVVKFLGRTLPSGARAAGGLQATQDRPGREYPDLNDIP